MQVKRSATRVRWAPITFVIVQKLLLLLGLSPSPDDNDVESRARSCVTRSSSSAAWSRDHGLPPLTAQYLQPSRGCSRGSGERVPRHAHDVASLASRNHRSPLVLPAHWSFAQRARRRGSCARRSACSRESAMGLCSHRRRVEKAWPHHFGIERAQRASTPSAQTNRATSTACHLTLLGIRSTDSLEINPSRSRPTDHARSPAELAAATRT